MKALFLITLMVFCCSRVLASPPETNGEMESFLLRKGLTRQLENLPASTQKRLSEHASDLVINALGFLGVPYKYGGDSVESGGFDCSGFVRAVYEQSIGQVLPRETREQAAATQIIDRQDLTPGDLVFFNTMKRAFSHVGIYVGGGKFIHAPRAGSNIRLDDMRENYWQQRFDGARRVISSVLRDAHLNAVISSE